MHPRVHRVVEIARISNKTMAGSLDSAPEFLFRCPMFDPAVAEFFRKITTPQCTLCPRMYSVVKIARILANKTNKGFNSASIKIRPSWFRFMKLLCNTTSSKKFDFLHHISKALRKLKKSCFALDHLYIELKTKSLFTTTSNDLPFKFKCWLQNSTFDSHLLYCEVDSLKPS